MKKYFKYINNITKSFLVLIFVISLSTTTSSNRHFKSSNTNDNLTLDLNSMALKVEEDIKQDLYSSKDTYVGYLTGYVYNCPLCSGRLSCMSSLDLSNGNVTYNDSTYGQLNIVASSRNLDCGTVVRINNSKIGDIYAIVLDRGVSGNNLDLLSPDTSYATSNIGRSVVSYDVLRKGY